MAKREKEAVEKHLKASLPKKRASPTREQQKSALLVSGLSELAQELGPRLLYSWLYKLWLRGKVLSRHWELGVFRLLTH